MRIVVDENIPFAAEAFNTVGETKIMPGRQITSEVMRDTDILICRHVTKVNKDLLAASKVKFVGTATAGYEHMDLAYLKSRGIVFAHAAGCNSNSVAEYILAALLRLHKRGKIDIKKTSLGVVGVGNVGSKVVKKARALGMKVLQNDPPRARESTSPEFLSLEELMECDVITLHVPLVEQGQDMTRHLFNNEQFSKMKKGGILINTCRGKVVDQDALKAALKNNQLSAALLDVWYTEPDIDTELLDMVEIATPHIAGLSLEGKTNGTGMIYQSLCRFLNITPVWDYNLPASDIPVLEKSILENDFLEKINEIVHTLYDIEKDDKALRKLSTLPQEEQKNYFDGLRKNYRRREFSNTKITVKTTDLSIQLRLKAMGFTLAT